MNICKISATLKPYSLHFYILGKDNDHNSEKYSTYFLKIKALHIGKDPKISAPTHESHSERDGQDSGGGKWRGHWHWCSVGLHHF